MEDQNKSHSYEISEKFVIAFDKVCRFCLSETKSGISVYDKCILEESKNLEEDSIHNFVTRMTFIKIEDSEKFPAQICHNCYNLVQLCYMFSQLCQKSDAILKNCHQNSFSYSEEGGDEAEKKKVAENSHSQEYSTHISEKLNELKKSKNICVFQISKQKLNLSEKLKNPNFFQKFRNASGFNPYIIANQCEKIVKFQCKICAKSFINEKKLLNHLKIFHSTSTPELKDDKKEDNFCFYCTPCKEFENRDQLLKHLRISHKSKSKFLKCIQCSDLFSTRLSLNQHLSLVHKQKVVYVGAENAKRQGLKQSSEEKYFAVFHDPSNDFYSSHGESKFSEKCKTKNKPWICSKCKASYSRKESLHHHLREKHNQTAFGRVKCPEPDCSESFATNRRLLHHGITAHQKYFTDFHKVFKKIIQPSSMETNKEKNFECDICRKKYIYKSSLRKHILTAHLGMSDKETVVCSYCNKTISSKLNLKSHIELVHEALFVFCPICKKKINFRTIGKHYKTHTTTTDMIYSRDIFLCRLCGKILKSKRSFEDHQTLHENVKSELCDICGSGFTTKKFLRLHKRIHNGSQRKVYRCDQCDKAFSGSHSLSRHRLTHSGKKNFICEICSKCFYTISELKRHVRFHKKDYRFDCQLCDKRFFDKSPFRHHMMKHRNVRPHKCQFCEKMFIVRGKMILHMVSKHNVDLTEAKKIWKGPTTYVSLDDLL